MDNPQTINNLVSSSIGSNGALNMSKCDPAPQKKQKVARHEFLVTIL